MQPIYTYKAPLDVKMRPLSGLKPSNNIWDGDLPEPILVSAYQESLEEMHESMCQVIEKLELTQAQAQGLAGLTDVYHQAVLTTVMCSARRISVEYDGCEINTGVPLD